MTKRQREVARAVIECQLEGQVPTRGELAKRVGLGDSDSIQKHLRNLEHLGILEREGSGSYLNQTRTLRVIWPAKNLIRPPYKVLWEMVNGRLAYTTREIRPSQLDQQKGNSHV